MSRLVSSDLLRDASPSRDTLYESYIDDVTTENEAAIVTSQREQTVRAANRLAAASASPQKVYLV